MKKIMLHMMVLVSMCLCAGDYDPAFVYTGSAKGVGLFGDGMSQYRSKVDDHTPLSRLNYLNNLSNRVSMLEFDATGEEAYVLRCQTVELQAEMKRLSQQVNLQKKSDRRMEECKAIGDKDSDE